MKLILTPLTEDNVNSGPLRAYLQAYCLRRTSTCLNLPTSVQEDVLLQFSREEQHLYASILDDTEREIDAAVSSTATIKRYNKLFTAIHKMRMLCNLGTTSLSRSNTESLTPQSSEIECTSCSAKDEVYLMVLSSCAFCPGCGRSLTASSPLPDPVNGGLANILGDTNRVLQGASQLLQTQQNPFLRSGYSTKLSAVTQIVSRSAPEDKQ